MERVISVVNEDIGVKFNVRIVKKGEKHGRNFALVYDSDKPLVEFYDDRYKEGFGKYGQFVSSYYAESIKDMSTGLNLNAGIDSWSVSKENMQVITKWINSNI